MTTEFDKMISDPEAARKDTRFAVVEGNQRTRQELHMRRKRQYDAELHSMWQTEYMRKLFRDFTQLRDEAAESAADAAGVARWKALHDVVRRLEHDRRKATGEQT